MSYLSNVYIETESLIVRSFTDRDFDQFSKLLV